MCKCKLFIFQFETEKWNHPLDGTSIIEENKEDACKIFRTLGTFNLKDWKITKIKIQKGAVL